MLAEYIYTRADQQICRPVIADIVAKQDRVTGDYSPFWDSRNYMNDIDNVHAATLVAHGNNDWNVMTKNAAQFYEALKARGVPHQLYCHQGGHGGSPPTSMLNRWFTRYLWNVENGVETRRRRGSCARRTRARRARRRSVGDQSNVTTLPVADSSQAPDRLHGHRPADQLDRHDHQHDARSITAIPDATHVDAQRRRSPPRRRPARRRTAQFV